MGKYMRKAKTTAEVAVMDLPLGVRTRAKTLALQRQARPPPPPPPPAAPIAPSSGYLQLRSRRLLKPPQIVLHDAKRQRQQSAHQSSKSQQQSTRQSSKTQLQNTDPNPSPNSRPDSISGSNPTTKPGSKTRVDGPNDSVSPGSGRRNEVNGEGIHEDDNNNQSKDLGIEASFGENVLDFEGRERSTRESTPCSLIRDPEAIRTPGSTTRPTSSAGANRRMHNSMRRHIPTALEMDEFFAGAEKEQQKRFTEKYNFDPLNDKPLPGRYEWEKLDP